VSCLGEILTAKGGVPPEQVRAALEGQVIYGGRLGTNLLELGAATEEQVAQGLAQQHGCPALWGEIGSEPRALDLLKPDLVDRLEAVPLRLDGRRLSVLVRDPRDLDRIDQVAFATGKEIRPVVVVESRLWWLMRHHYALHRPVRGLELLAQRAPPPPPVAPASPAAPDLMDEADFNALYDRAPQKAPPGAAAAEPAPSAPAADGFHGNLVSTEEVLAALQVEASQAAERAIPVPEGEPPPLGFEDAVRMLEGVADRDAIARAVLRHARSRLRRAVLLTVRGSRADGWEGMGEGLTPQTVARVHVPCDQPGVFQTVVESRAHFLGPLQKTEANLRFLRALGGGAPRNSFAMPILARGEVVNVLYADNGRGELVDPGGVGELLILAAKITRSYDVLLSRAV
jgi:hypothetical protein